MWPRIGPLPTFGVLYSISILSHFLIGYLLAKRLRLRHRVWLVVGICYMIGMTIGAKALYDIQHAQFDFRALFSTGHYMQGGLWGGLLTYFVLAVPLVLVLAKHRWAALDLIALSIPIPWVFVKLGCLFHGDCYGTKCSLPWAITFPEGAAGAPAGIPLHPTQIYEILVVLCVLVVFKILKYERWRGTMLLWFLILYGLGRAATEFFRADFDHHLYIGPLSLSQLVCLVAAGVAILLLFLWCRFFSSTPQGRKLKNPESSCNNLFLLGAGFTRAVFPNAPLNKDLLPVLCKGTPLKILKKYYNEYKTEDIEILLTRLDLDIFHPKVTQRTALQTVRRTIERQLAEYFGQYRFKEEILDKSTWLEEFVDLFQPNDSIISLNYDCLLEGVLDYYEVWSPKEGYAMLDGNPLLDSDFPQNKKNIRIFKLHGSEHFVEAPDPMNKTKTAIGFPIDESIYPRSGKNRHLGYGMGMPEARNYIIAPSFVKMPHQDIELMMLKALKTAESVKNFVIIGCGFRKEDSFLWLLLTNFLNQPINNRKLIIVDPYAENIKAKICDHYFVDINNFINIKLFSNGLELVIKQLINELHDNNA